MGRLSTRLRLEQHDYPLESASVVFVRGIVGVAMQLGPGSAQLRAGIRRFGDPDLSSLQGALTAVEADLGYRWDLW